MEHGSTAKVELFEKGECTVFEKVIGAMRKDLDGESISQYAIPENTANLAVLTAIGDSFE
jgi:hypothetical protein